MDHRQPPAGYHTRTAARLVARAVAGAGGLALAACAEVACVMPALAPVTPGEAAPQEPFRTERGAAVAAINALRAAAGVRPLAYDALLQRVGDLHCARLLADGVWGHFALDGVPPYARYLLAGGHGYHRENAASRSSSIGVAPDAVGTILLDGVARMDAERPPDDGHRRALLDPTATHIGIGLAVEGGEVRVTHEIAAELAVEWSPAPPATRPQTPLAVAGRIAPPWEVAAVEVLWQPIPPPLTPAEAIAAGSYAYPPRRSIVYAANPAIAAGEGGGGGRLEARGGGVFAFAWAAGPRPGLEVVLVWAHRSPGGRALTAVAASCTVVTPDGALPPAYRRWVALAVPPPTPLPGAG